MMVVSLVTLLTGLSIGAAILYSGNQLQSWQVSQQALWCIGILTVAGLAMYCRSEVARQTYLPAGLATAFALLIFGVYTAAAPAVDMCRSDLDLILADHQTPTHDADTSPHHESDWLCIGTLEPSWIYYANHNIREIPAHRSSSGADVRSPDWRSVAREHLQRPNARLLIPGSLVGELEQYLDETKSAIATEVSEAPRFMRRDTLAILRPVTRTSSVRLSQAPSSGR
jgi:hypothetical protein